MFVQEDGPVDGAPLLLVHGFASSLHSWSLVAARLADRYQVIRVDLLGHGTTGGAAADAPAQAEAVAAVLTRIDVRGVTVVGHSFGADVAVDLAEHCDRVDSLVIVAQSPDYSQANLPRAGVMMTYPRVSPLLYRGVRPLFTALAAVTERRSGRSQASGVRDFAAQGLRDLRALDPAMFRIVLVERRARMAARPLDAQVVAAGKPTLVVLGGRDHFYGVRAAPRYRAAGATVEVIADSGHAMPIEYPGRLAGLIDAFAGSRQPPSGRPSAAT